MKAKSKLDEAVKRRVRAGRLLLAGKSPPEVARMVGAPRQTVYRWQKVLAIGGIEALRDMSKGGRPAQLGAAELSQLYVALLEGATAHGFATPLWTLKRVRLWIERELGVQYSEVHVWRLLGQLGPNAARSSLGHLKVAAIAKAASGPGACPPLPGAGCTLESFPRRARPWKRNSLAPKSVALRSCGYALHSFVPNKSRSCP
jgi:transposase